MKSPVVKRSIVIAGHKTSVSLEDAFWNALKEIADQRDNTLSDLVASIDQQRAHGNLSSAIRLFVLDHFRERSAVCEQERGRGGDAGQHRAGVEARSGQDAGGETMGRRHESSVLRPAE